MKRRDFVRNISIAGAGIGILNPLPSFSKPSASKVRLGIIGTGLRGQNHLWNALQREDVEVIAICDVDEVSLQSARELVTKSGTAHAQNIHRRSACLPKVAGRKRSAGYPDRNALGMAYADDPRWHLGWYQIHRNGSGIGHYPAGSLECSRSSDHSRSPGNDDGKCLLPQRCDGDFANGEAGTFWRTHSSCRQDTSTTCGV